MILSYRSKWFYLILMSILIFALSGMVNGAVCPTIPAAQEKFHPLYGNFDIPIDAANDLLSTAYYSNQLPTYFSGSTSGTIQVALTIYQPHQSDIDLVEGSLYLGMKLRVAGTFTIDDQTKSFDQVVGMRLGLKQGPSLMFSQAPIQFLDNTIPQIIRDVLVENIQNKLMVNSSFTVTIENVINTLSTMQTSFVRNQFDYEISLNRPSLEVKTYLVKPCIFCFYNEPVAYTLHIPVHVAVQADGRRQEYDIDIHPSMGLGGRELNINYALTDEQVDIVIVDIQNFIADLPAVVRQELESTLIGRTITLYKGRIIDYANSLVPSDMNIRFTNQILFSLPLAYLNDLELGVRDNNIGPAFSTQGYPLSGRSGLTTKEIGQRWYINDGDNGLYELVVQTNNIRVQVPAAAVDVRLLTDRIRFTLRLNVLSTSASFGINAAPEWGDAQSFTIAGNVSGNIVLLDISDTEGKQVKDFGTTDLPQNQCGSFSRSILWELNNNKGQVVGSGYYIIRAVINTGHKLYTLTKKISVAK